MLKKGIELLNQLQDKYDVNVVYMTINGVEFEYDNNRGLQEYHNGYDYNTKEVFVGTLEEFIANNDINDLTFEVQVNEASIGNFEDFLNDLGIPPKFLERFEAPESASHTYEQYSFKV